MDPLGELLKGKGRIFLIRYQEGSASTTAREAGFLDAIAAMGGTVTLDVALTDVPDFPVPVIVASDDVAEGAVPPLDRPTFKQMEEACRQPAKGGSPKAAPKT